MERDPTAYAVIGHAMAVHREIGPGLNEVLYHAALGERLQGAGIEHLLKPRGRLEHRGSLVDLFEPDLVLPTKLVPELKVLIGGFKPEHFLQLKAYLKYWRIRRGLLLDFGKESLVMRSYVYDDPPRPQIAPQQLMLNAPATAEPSFVRALVESLGRIAVLHGFGYRDTTYRALIVADLRAEGIHCLPAPTAPVHFGGKVLGESTLSRVVVAGEGALLVLAQRDGIGPADRAYAQTAMRHLTLPWGVIAHFGRDLLEVQWVVPLRGAAPIRTDVCIDPG